MKTFTLGPLLSNQLFNPFDREVKRLPVNDILATRDPGGLSVRRHVFESNRSRRLNGARKYSDTENAFRPHGRFEYTHGHSDHDDIPPDGRGGYLFGTPDSLKRILRHSSGHAFTVL